MGDQNPNEAELTKQEKLELLQNLGVVGTDEGSATILNLAHAELDYLIDFNSKKEAVQTESPSEALKKKYDNEVIKRREAESSLKTFKQTIINHAQTLVEAAKKDK